MEDARNNFLFAGDTTTRADGFAGDTRAHSRAGTSVKPSVAFADCAAGVLASVPLTDCASDPVDGALPALASSWASGRRLVGGRVPVQLQLCPFALARCNLFKRALARASACASLHIEVLPAAGAAARVTGPTLFSLQVPKRELVPQSQTSRRLHALARSSRQVPRSVGKQEGLCSFRTNNSHPQYLEESWARGDRRNHHLGSYLSRITAPRKGLEFRILPVRKSPRSRNDSRVFLSASSFVAAWAASSWTSPVAAPYTCTTSLS